MTSSKGMAALILSPVIRSLNDAMRRLSLEPDPDRGGDEMAWGDAAQDDAFAALRKAAAVSQVAEIRGIAGTIPPSAASAVPPSAAAAAPTAAESAPVANPAVKMPSISTATTRLAARRLSLWTPLAFAVRSKLDGEAAPATSTVMEAGTVLPDTVLAVSQLDSGLPKTAPHRRFAPSAVTPRARRNGLSASAPAAKMPSFFTATTRPAARRLSLWTPPAFAVRSKLDGEAVSATSTVMEASTALPDTVLAVSQPDSGVPKTAPHRRFAPSAVTPRARRNGLSASAAPPRMADVPGATSVDTVLASAGRDANAHAPADLGSSQRPAQPTPFDTTAPSRTGSRVYSPLSLPHSGQPVPAVTLPGTDGLKPGMLPLRAVALLVPPPSAAFAPTSAERSPAPRPFAELPMHLRREARRMDHALAPVVERAAMLSETALAAAVTESDGFADDGAAPPSAPQGLVSNTFNVTVNMDAARPEAAADREALQDALSAILMDSARRQGLDL